MNSKDLKILEKLKTGNPSGYKELFDLYYMPLSIHSLKYCNLFELAQDIVQDLFVKFWDEKIYMKLDEANSPYLFKSIKNNTLQVIKKIRREDLIRHDKFILSAQARGATNAQPFHVRFPIPQSVMDANSALIQNDRHWILDNVYEFRHSRNVFYINENKPYEI